MYIVRDTERTYAYDLFFIMCVVFGTFVILNLMIAVQASYLDQAFEEEDQQNQEREEKKKLKEKLQKEQEEMMEEEDEDEEDGFDDVQANGTGRTSERRGTKEKEVKKGCCSNM